MLRRSVSSSRMWKNAPFSIRLGEIYVQQLLQEGFVQVNDSYNQSNQSKRFEKDDVALVIVYSLDSNSYQIRIGNANASNTWL